ncbi:unnamed protein product [Ambrosiozyma monospora]|uniref:Unnamed protein product n=1 Tax=Ambrosiozyma monospora TaxID=43982 RepID=A0ACB5ST82_AMBMO|nr:unnamed protein product [Ambrosiozyma monospora]
MVDVSKDDSFNKTKPISYPITDSKKLHKQYLGYYHGYYNRWGNVTTSHWLGIASLSMWGALMVISGALHWLGILVPSLKSKLTGSLFNAYRKNISLAPTFKKHHINPVQSLFAQGYIPTRFESIVIGIHFLYSILSCAIIGYGYYPGDKVFKTYMAAVARYYGDRAIIFAVYQIPLVYLFAGRNNFMQWITGWSYSRFVTFHKWLSRMLILEILIHSLAFTAQSVALGKLQSRLAADYYRYGIVATVSSCLAMVLAMYTIRRYAYECFLVTHIILIVMFTWTAYKHALDQEYENYFWACIAIWCFDTVVRMARIVYCGLIRKAHAIFLVEENTIKLTIPVPSYVKTYPGAHCFIYFLTPSTFWQSHPFTVVKSITDEGHIHLYCKVKEGITKALLQKFHASEGSSVDVKVLVEGIYGEQNPYHHYDKAVLIAGGNGISGPFSHALKLATTDVKTETKLYWQVREYSVLNWFGEELMQLKNTKVQPIIYVSNPSSSLSEVYNNSSSSSGEHSDSSSGNEGKEESAGGEKTKESLVNKFDFIEFHSGRMNVSEVVAQEIQETVGSVAFGACAHPDMADEVRVAVKNNLNVSNKRVDYFEEMQSW